jgi:hypothetical protein
MSSWIGWKPRSTNPRVASSRLRCLNPLSELRSRGYPVELFNPNHVDRYAAVIYSKSYDDASYLEATMLQKRGIRIVFDLCDNHFYNPRGLSEWEEAAQRLRQMMATADELVSSTEALAEIMIEELSEPRPVTVIGDAVETEISGWVTPLWQRWFRERKLSKLLEELAKDREEGCIPLIWFGNHGSPNADGGMFDVLKIRPLLENMSRRYPLSLTVISNSRKKYHQAIASWSFPTRYLPWTPDTFFPALRAHSIAVIPISVNPFTRCKSNNRLALSLQAGLAVVADSIPSYLPFGEACYLDAWETGLERYLSDAELRRRHVEFGRAIIARECTPTRIADRWRHIFDQLRGQTQCHEKLL